MKNDNNQDHIPLANFWKLPGHQMADKDSNRQNYGNRDAYCSQAMETAQMPYK
jgi:hypothetical protein